MNVISEAASVLYGLMITLTELFKKELFRNDDIHKMKLEKFIPWFETTLLQITTFNFVTINAIMKDIDQSMITLSELSHESRSPMSNVQTSNRLQRVCDQIDLLCQEYNQGKHCKASQTPVLYPHNSLLPDSEYLRDLTSRVKNKLKVIEEVSQLKRADSGKNKGGGRGDSNSGSKKGFELPQTMREEIQKLSGYLEALELESMSKSLLLSHFASLKACVHKPFHQMRMLIADLPNIQQAKQQLTEESEAYGAAGTAYEEARTATVLQEIMSLRREVQGIEQIADEMFACIREFATGSHSKDCLALLRDDGSGTSAHSLITRLTKYCKCAPSDLLHMATLKDHAGSFIWLTCLTDVQRRISANNSSSSAAWASVVEAAAQFDGELLQAYVTDWNERIVNINHTLKSEEFVKAYRTLVAARTSIVRARGQYERAQQLYTSTLDRHRDATQQVEVLKERLKQVAMAELCEEVEFIA